MSGYVSSTHYRSPLWVDCDGALYVPADTSPMRTGHTRKVARQRVHWFVMCTSLRTIRPAKILPRSFFAASSSLSEETTPLVTGKTQRATSGVGYKLNTHRLLALSVSLFLIVNLFMHFVFCPLYPRTMVSIRRGWENEEAQHKLLRATWESEKQDHATLKKEWEHQRESHEKDVERRIKEEEERQEQVRQEWSQECKRHASAIDEYDKIVARRAQEEQERQERVRENWAQEVEKHRNEWKEMERHENQRRENERQKWRREVEDHDRMKEERRKREEEERKRLNLFWGSVEAHTCSTYATKEYTAQLMNLPATWDWEHRVEACRATPLEIHGISHLPITCEHKVGDFP